MNPISLYGRPSPIQFGKIKTVVATPEEPSDDDVELAIAGLEGLLKQSAKRRNGGGEDDPSLRFAGSNHRKSWIG